MLIDSLETGSCHLASSPSNYIMIYLFVYFKKDNHYNQPLLL